MKVVLSYSAKDYNLAFSAANLLVDKTDMPREKLIMHGSLYAPDPGERLTEKIGRFLQPASDRAEYPLGPNMMIAHLFKRMREEGWDEPVFLCEPDGFPTRKDWYSAILEAHNSTGKLCSGSWVGWVDPPHYNGNMVVDPVIVKMNPSLTRVCWEAWDVFHAEFFEQIGASNVEIHNPRRKIAYYPTKWYYGQAKDGKIPAWIHGCQNFQCWERIEREGFGDDS